MEGYARLRNVFLEIGNEFARDRIINDKNDIFFLKPFEILSLLRDGKSIKHAVYLIGERKAEKVFWESQAAPDLIIEDNMEDSDSQSDIMKGIGCSPGIVEGKARVLIELSEAYSFNPGEILVARYTDPGWTPLFLSCKAVVTEIGGFLSHGATVAREYGIPAVVSVPEATSKIKTGDTIKVNGTKGIITICNKEQNDYSTKR
jgi:pyruvate,water dikinase